MPSDTSVPLIRVGSEMAERRRVMRKWVSGSDRDAAEGGAVEALREARRIRAGCFHNFDRSRDVEAMSRVLVAVHDKGWSTRLKLMPSSHGLHNLPIFPSDRTLES